MFDWSSLPCEIKRIIFKYNRLTTSKHIELKNLSKIKLHNDLIRFVNDKSYREDTSIKIISFPMGLLYFRKSHGVYQLSYKLGVNFNFYDISFRLDNLCYICNKNKNITIPLIINWYNTIKQKYIRDTIHVCSCCEFEHDLIFDSKECRFKGRLLLDIFKEEYFS